MPKDFILGKNSAKNQFDNVAERISTVFHPTLAILMHTDLAVVVTANVGTRSVIHSLSFSLREEGKKWIFTRFESTQAISAPADNLSQGMVLETLLAKAGLFFHTVLSIFSA